jgi:rSAM/selenodomain-associated transferase 2
MAENPLEVIVADGHSEDNTLSLAQKAGALTFSCPRGRGKQMNAAARLALGENLLFLHADTSLPSGWSKELLKLLATPHTVAGAFSFKLDISSPGLWLIEKTVALRCLLASLPYGDQALFLKTDLFRSVGGFKEQPIMEDWDLIKRLKKKGKIKISSLPAVTSARRWQNLGLWRTTLVNYLIPAMYMLGASPDICYRIYYGWQVSQLPRKKNP